jgi:uncharacterized protein YeaO (DUF488 family)
VSDDRPAGHATVRLERVFDPPARDGGVRVLVDRAWPDGLTRPRACVHEWLRELGPSTALRKWFAQDPGRWEEFRRRYRAELSAPEQRRRLAHLRKLAARRRVTILYGARDALHNPAVVIAEELAGARDEG